MEKIFIVSIVCAALSLSLFIGIFALFKSQSYKKNYFLLMQAMVVLYLLGYLFEITSTTAEEAFGGVKVLYAGASFVAVFAFFFVSEYCNIKLHRVFVKAPMVILSLAAAVTMWTTKIHRLVYIEYGFLEEHTSHLYFVPGPLYSVIHSYPTICILLAMAVLLYQIKKWWKSKYRRRLLILFISVLIPFIVEGIYYLFIILGMNPRYLYFTPYSVALMTFFLYLGVVRFNIFEIISRATVTAMEHIREGFVLVDEENNYLSSNPAAAAILPGIAKLVYGQSIVAANGWPKEFKNMESGSVDFSIVDGDTRHYRASVSPVLEKNRTLVAKIILFGDITDHVVLMKQLENAAYIDALTGLYNRKHFSELAVVDIERALRSNQSIYTAMLDLDFFKQVNDTHGHDAGDLVLKTTAGIIRQTIRSYDLLCRYGGEEFVLLFADLDMTEACKMTERIRENMENYVSNYEGAEIKVTCSIGLARFIEGDTLETAIRKADMALYAAKNSGRNQVQVYGSV